MAQSSKRWILGIVAIVLLCLVCIGGTGAGLGYLTLRPKTLASDGGVELVLRTEADARDAALEVVVRRIDEMEGARGATVVAQGDDKIVVQVPGTTDSQALTAVLSRGGSLQFLPVSSAAYTFDLTQQGERFRNEREAAGETVTDAQVDAFLASQLLGELSLHWSARIDDVTGLRVRDQAYALHPDARLTGEMIGDASVGYDQFNMPYVALEFDDLGAEAFCSLTGDLAGSDLAIVLDGEVLSAPRVIEPICGGRAQITLGSGGSADQLLREAQDLALTLRAGALPAPVTIESVSVVSPTG
jgi:protein-export membrane protein SecD